MLELDFPDGGSVVLGVIAIKLALGDAGPTVRAQGLDPGGLRDLAALRASCDEQRA